MVLEILLLWLVVLKAFCGGLPFFEISQKNELGSKKEGRKKRVKENDKNPTSYDTYRNVDLRIIAIDCE